MRAQAILARLATLAALSVGSADPGVAQRSSSLSDATSATTEVSRLADAYVARVATTYPEFAVFAGLPDAPQDRFSDNRIAIVRRHEAFEDSVWFVLQTIPAASLAGTPDEVTYAQLREALEGWRGQRVCKSELWPVSAPSGWQGVWAQLADIQPVGTPANRKAALARWRGAGRYLDVERANLKDGLRRGFTAPTAGVRAVLEQLDGLIATPVDSLPFMGPTRRDTTPTFRKAFRAAIADSLLPAARRYRDFLRTEYLPKTKASVTANPNGETCYRALLRSASGVDRDPRQLLREISMKVAQDSVALLALAAQVYPPPAAGRARDATWLRAAIEADSADVIPTADSVVAFTRAVMARAREALPRAFSNVPSTDVTLVAFPAYQQPTAPGGQYVPAASDGSRPATYYYRTYPPVHRIGLATTVVHETWPGHHLQAAIARERPRHRMALLSSLPGFTEGWGQYSEFLADELGVFQEPRDRFDRVVTLAPIMVADLGMNLLGWSPTQAEDYLVGAMPHASRNRIRSIVAYLSSIPGYVASYTVGALEIQRLRAEAEAALGPRFDLRAFHEIVLRDGAVPLTLVRERVERWVRDERGKRAR